MCPPPIGLAFPPGEILADANFKQVLTEYLCDTISVYVSTRTEYLRDPVS